MADRKFARSLRKVGVGDDVNDASLARVGAGVLKSLPARSFHADVAAQKIVEEE